MRKDVEFQSKGETCRGWLYTPDSGEGPFPAVVMAGGWCYVRELVMPHYAEFFTKAIGGSFPTQLPARRRPFRVGPSPRPTRRFWSSKKQMRLYTKIRVRSNPSSC